jgi:predicted nucleotidyltransferase component of viral defense system
MERFLYRLAQSRFADRFILKGALLLTAWKAPISRPTIDIDLAASTNNNLNHIRAFMMELCRVETPRDGITFQAESVKVSRIAEDADYEGVRVRFHATLARARVPMQIDIAFGDVIVPGPTQLSYPTLLEFPAPVLLAYSKETVIAEKLEALTVLGLLNSRMKDYYDLALLARLYMFVGDRVLDAIRATFHHRKTNIETEPVGLTKAYYSDPAKGLQWRAFLRRSRFPDEAGGFHALVSEVRDFATAPLSAAATERPFNSRWRPGGPWQ